MLNAIRFYSQFPSSDEMKKNIPPQWPATHRQIKRRSEAEPDETVLSDAEFELYLRTWEPIKEAWNQAQVEKYSPPEDLPNFRRGMLASSGYQRIGSTNPFVASQIQTAICMADIDWISVCMLWNYRLVDTLAEADKVTAQEIAQWNMIRAATNTRVEFDTVGHLFRTVE